MPGRLVGHGESPLGGPLPIWGRGLLRDRPRPVRGGARHRRRPWHARGWGHAGETRLGRLALAIAWVHWLEPLPG